MPPPPHHPPSKSAIARARAAYEAGRRAAAAAVERVERKRAAWARTAALAQARFVCPGCGLNFPLRRAADPAAPPPLRCLCCAFLVTVADARTREALRRVLGRARLQRRFGGRDGPPAP